MSEFPELMDDPIALEAYLGTCVMRLVRSLEAMPEYGEEA